MDTEHPERIGQYEIQGLIGKGAMGKVYKAVQPSLNRTVAIKVLPAEFMEDEDRVERFNREAQAVALLNHPNVVQIIEKDQEGDQLYFVMEYVPGTSLDAILKQRRLSLPEALRVFKGVCLGLEAAHQKKVIHRDLSPRNVLVSEDLSTVKLVDFGISRVEAISVEEGTLSTSEFSLGSLHYMAPEQARNMVTADHRADIYSLGVLLYEMLTGRVPVGRFNLPSQLNSEVPHEMDPIVLRCLEAEPQDRYQSVRRLRAQMRRLEDQLRLGLVHEVREIGSSTSKIILNSTKNRSLWIGLAGVAAVVAVGGVLFFGGKLGGGSGDAAVAETASEPIEIVEHERPQAVDNEVDPLEAALADVEAPPPTEVPEVEEPTAPAAQPAPRGPQPSAANPPAQRAGPDESALTKDMEVARNKLDAGLLDEAIADLERLISEHPEADATAGAHLLLGSIHERQRNPDKARAAYVELQSRFPATEEAAESMHRSAKLLEAEGSRDQLRAARAMLDELAAKHPGSQWAVRGLLDKAAIEIEAKWEVQDPLLGQQVPAALMTYREFASRFPNDPGAEKALLGLGEMYEELKEFDKAAIAFENLAQKFPANRHDAWWRAGQIYDRRLDQNDKAIEAYRKVPESSRRHGDAQRRINRLSRR